MPQHVGSGWHRDVLILTPFIVGTHRAAEANTEQSLMAANSYYNTHSHDAANPYHDYPERQQEHSVVSPLASPYDDDRTQPYSHQAPTTSYSGASSRLHDDSDPFDDGNAIPLNGRKPQHSSTQTITPILPPEDPFVRDVDPREQRRGRGRGGWFTAPITWVVYVLTVIQLIVFIFEIVKNGKRIPGNRLAQLRWILMFTRSNFDRLTN